MTEADTCRLLITPKLQAAGWENDPHSIAEQHSFTDGRLVVRGNQAERRKRKRAPISCSASRVNFPSPSNSATPSTNCKRCSMRLKL
jgi:hypothetical protein